MLQNINVCLSWLHRVPTVSWLQFCLLQYRLTYGVIVSGYLAPDYCCQWFILNEVDLLHFLWAGIHKIPILIIGEATWAQVGVKLRFTPHFVPSSVCCFFPDFCFASLITAETGFCSVLNWCPYSVRLSPLCWKYQFWFGGLLLLNIWSSTHSIISSRYLEVSFLWSKWLAVVAFYWE